MIAVALAAFATLAFSRTEPAVSGDIPPSIQSPVGAEWIDANGHPHRCEMGLGRWTCTIPNGSHGLVVVVGNSQVAYGVCTSTAVGPLEMARWGSPITIVASGVLDQDLDDIHITAKMPERSAHRPRSTRFETVAQPGVRIVKLSETAFWVAGSDIDPAAFLAVEGPSIASTWVPIAALANNTAGEAVAVQAAAPSTLTGRVQNARGEDIENVSVDLYVPLVSQTASELHESAPGDDSKTDGHKRDVPSAMAAMRVAGTRSQPGGLFTFDRLSEGPFILSVADPRAGRASALIHSVAEPAVLRLITPPKASGRVLRHDLPVTGATVRFIPTPDAFRNSLDPQELAAEPQTSGDDGRFTVLLPPLLSGLLAITAPDGTLVRVHIDSPGPDGEIVLGDIAVPDPVQLTIRLLDPTRCEMSAAGPLGSLGLSVVTGRSVSNVYLFDIPEPGEWALNASCGGRSVVLQPQIVSVPPAGSQPPPVDVRIAPPGG